MYLARNNSLLRCAATLVLTLAVITVLVGCGGKPAETTEPETTAAVETTVPETTVAETAALEVTIPEVEDYLIATPYGDLHYPGDWSSFLLTEKNDGSPCTVTFFAVLDSREAPQKLFTITLGGTADTAIGAVKAPDGTYAAVKVENIAFVPDESWSDRDINIVFTMQEALNYVLENLDMEDVSVLTPAEKPAELAAENPDDAQSAGQVNPDDMAMDTPYMELHYPSKWADYLSINVTEDNDTYSVSYACVIGSHAEQHLFTVWFGGDHGMSLKSIKDDSGEMVEVRIEVTEISLDESWSEEEKNIVLAMQEDLNYLLARMA